MPESTYLIYSVLGAHYAVSTSYIGKRENPKQIQGNSRLVELIEKIGHRVLAYQPDGLLLLYQNLNHDDRFKRLHALGDKKYNQISLLPGEKFCDVFYE